MAKGKNEELKWQAEDIVRKAIEGTPGYKKAVRQTITELRQVQKVAAKTIRHK